MEGAVVERTAIGIAGIWHSSSDVRLRLTCGLGAFTAGVAAQRVIAGYLDEDQRDAVGIGDVHFVQTPRFAAGLAGDRHASALQLCLRRGHIAHLQPQRTRERPAGWSGAPWPASSISDWPA